VEKIGRYEEELEILLQNAKEIIAVNKLRKKISAMAPALENCVGYLCQAYGKAITNIAMKNV